MTKQRGIIVTGYWHPPPVHDPDYPGWFLREDEKNDTCKGFKGKPVYVEHDDDKKQVGVIHRLWQENSTRALGCDVMLNTDEDGMRVLGRIMSKDLAGFSFGAYSQRNEDWERTAAYYPKEISLVKKGDLPGTRIVAFQFDDKVYALPQNILYSENSAARSRAMQAENTNAETDELSGVPKEMLLLALKEHKARVAREAEEEVKRQKEFEDLVDNQLTKDWQKAVLDGVVEFDPLFGQFIDDAVESKSAAARAGILCLASALKGNTSSNEKKRLEMAEKSKEGMATPEERKQPVGNGKRAALFQKPEPAVPAANTGIPTEVANSATKGGEAAAPATTSAGKSRLEAFQDPIKLAKLQSELQKELNKNA
jgi:hypothetical protein